MKKTALFFFLSLFISASFFPALSRTQSVDRALYEDYNGTMTPIPLPEKLTQWWPDSLSPYFVNHLGRHGARYLSSAKKVEKMERFLRDQDKKGNLSPRGTAALRLLDTVIAKSSGKWGYLTELGRHEEKTIASLTASLAPDIFKKGMVMSIASYVPRVVESQYAFCLSLSELSDSIQILTMEGMEFNNLVRPFEYDRSYAHFRSSGDWKREYDKVMEKKAPSDPVLHLLLDSDGISPREARSLSLEFYGILQGMTSSGIDCDPAVWFSPEEYQTCAKLSNLQRYYRNAVNPFSSLAAQSCIPLLEDIIDSGKDIPVYNTFHPGGIQLAAYLRFGHDETIMPLLSLMNIGGGYRPDLPADINVVWREWNSATLFPLGANLQLFYLVSPGGLRYVAAMLNENPVKPFDDAPGLIVPLDIFNNYMMQRIEKFKK